MTTVIEQPHEEQARAALLLPLSGRLATLGRAMWEAAQVALFDAADRRFEIAPYDDGGTPQGAARAARAAVADGSQIILGPLLATSVRAVAPIATAANVPVVAFSSDRKVAGPGVHIIGFTPEAEVQRVVSFAASRGLKNFGAVAPDNAYGAAVLDSFRKTVTANKGSVVRIETYDPATQDFTQVARKLSGIAPSETSTPGANSSGANSSGANTTETAPATAMPPLPAFDAILLAEGGQQLPELATALAQVGIRSPVVQLLGTGKWDEPGLGSEPTLVGAWYAGPVPLYREEFEVRFKRLFGQPAPRLATLAYDATALAAVLARGPEANPFSERALEDPNGFLGRDGLFRLTESGVAERELAILRVERSGAVVIDEPPRTFAAGT